METCNREFNEIYKKYKNLVLKVAYTNSGNNYDAADDISQEIFLKLYENFDSLNTERVGGWLSKSARNSAIDFRKKYGRELPVEDDILRSEEPSRESAEEDYLDHELEAERRILHEKIFAGLSEKNPRWHEAILLVYYMEIPQAKAAEIMGIHVSVLHSILHRARRWIKKTYGAEYEEMKGIK